MDFTFQSVYTSQNLKLVNIGLDRPLGRDIVDSLIGENMFDPCDFRKYLTYL